MLSSVYNANRKDVALLVKKCDGYGSVSAVLLFMMLLVRLSSFFIFHSINIYQGGKAQMELRSVWF